VEETIRSVDASGHAAKVSGLFDQFQSPEMKSAGERSLAFNLVFRSDDRTLEEREVDELIALVVKRLELELQARLRA